MIKTKVFLKDDGIIKSNRGKKYVDFIKPIYDEYKLIEDLNKKTPLS